MASHDLVIPTMRSWNQVGAPRTCGWSSIAAWKPLVIGANLRVTGAKSVRACSADSDDEANASAKQRTRIHDTGAFRGNAGSG
jgi:hypothetical protein